VEAEEEVHLVASRRHLLLQGQLHQRGELVGGSDGGGGGGAAEPRRGAHAGAQGIRGFAAPHQDPGDGDVHRGSYVQRGLRHAREKSRCSTGARGHDDRGGEALADGPLCYLLDALFSVAQHRGLRQGHIAAAQPSKLGCQFETFPAGNDAHKRAAGRGGRHHIAWIVVVGFCFRDKKTAVVIQKKKKKKEK
jgi:hypothetical protein